MVTSHRLLLPISATSNVQFTIDKDPIGFGQPESATLEKLLFLMGATSDRLECTLSSLDIAYY